MIGSAARAATREPGAVVAVSLVGLGLAVALRVALAGAAGARSVPAGAVFGTVLLALAVTLADRPARAGRPVPRYLARAALAGLAGAALLCAVPVARHLAAGGPFAIRPAAGNLAGYPGWAVVVTFVALAEEALLRGTLFTAAERWHGSGFAIVVTAVAFGLVHVPLYGTGVLPLDLAVGVLLGALRLLAGGVLAPAVCHAVADLAGWWLR